MIIEKNIKVPEVDKQGRSSPTMELIAKMEFGDSVLFKTRKKANYFCVQIRYFLRTRGHQMGRACLRTVPDGFRVWLLPPEDLSTPIGQRFVQGFNNLTKRNSEHNSLAHQ